MSAQGEVLELTALEGHLAHPGGSLVAGVQGRLQCRRLLGRRQQPDLHHQLHKHRTYTPARQATARSKSIT
jgi:hypothetical protein